MTQQDFPKRFAPLAPLLCKNHYCITPLKPNTKLPLLTHWQERPYTYQKLPLAHAYEDHGIGILCALGDAPVAAIDIDAPCKELSEAMKTWCIQTLGAAPERVGKAPKTLLIYRADTPGWKKTKSAVFYDKDHNKNQLEILGLGQQFVAFGKHPDTGKEFEWPDGSPIDTPACNLTIISAEKLQLAIEYFEGLAAEMGLSKASDSKTKTSISFAAGPDAQPDALDFMKSIPAQRLGMTYEQAKEALTFIKDNEDYDTWCAVGMALHYEFDGSDEAFDLWDEWSSTASNYAQYEGLQHKWTTFNRSGSDVLTGFWLRKRAQEGGLPVVVKRAYTEKGLADRFVDYYASTAKYADEIKVWYKWQGYCWDKISYPRFVTLFKVIVDNLKIEQNEITDEEEQKKISKLIAACEKGRIYAEVLKHIVGDERIQLLCNEFNKEEITDNIISFTNGFLNTRTWEFAPPNPENYITPDRVIDDIYDPRDEESPDFYKVVCDAFEGNEALIHYFLTLMGYALLGDPNEQIFIIAYGSEGGNGKSTIFNAIREALGPYAATANINTLISENNREDKGLELLNLIGKRFVMATEPSAFAKMRDSLIKSTTGGDEVKVRPLYHNDFISFTPKWLISILTNHMPYMNSDDGSMWRRTKIVPFDRVLRNDTSIVIDKDLPKKLREQKRGIRMTLFKYARVYQKEGLIEPPEITALIEKFRKEADPLNEWLEDDFEFDPSYVATNEEIWMSWQHYELVNGKQNIFTNMRTLGKRLSKRYTAIRDSHGIRGRGFLGLRLKKHNKPEDV